MAFDMSQMQGAQPPPQGLMSGPPGAGPPMGGPPQGGMPGGMPPGGGDDLSDMSTGRIKQEILSQLPFEQLEKIVTTMEPEEAIQKIMQGIMPEIEMGQPGPEDQDMALDIAGKIYEAIIDMVSEQKNMVLSDLNPAFKRLAEAPQQEQGPPQGQPPGSPMGGPPQGNAPAGPGVMTPQQGGF